jgi:hypothetical protein
MLVLSAIVALTFLGVSADTTPRVVSAPDCPVKLERVKLLGVGADEPPVLFYAATNPTDQPLEQFTVTAFVFDTEGRLKSRQVAPGRRTLEAHETKYSTMVLDGAPMQAGDVLVVGVDQAQRQDTEAWWKADLRQAAEAAAKSKQ